METNRIALELSEKERAEMERLMAFVGIKTESEFVSNALAMVRWAAMELLQGRKIGSIDDNGQWKPLGIPTLQSFHEFGREHVLPTPEELRERAHQPTRKLQELLAESTNRETSSDERSGTKLESSRV